MARRPNSLKPTKTAQWTHLTGINAGGSPLQVNVQKVHSYRFSNGQYVYIDNNTSRIDQNKIDRYVHPDLGLDFVRGLPVRTELSGFSWHANLLEFPKKLRNGNKPEHYGVKFTVYGLDDLEQVLRAVSRI